VTEIWYMTQGLGQMWRKHRNGFQETVDLRPGVAVTIPVGTSFQFRNTGRDPLAIVGVTMPPWPGEGEATEVEGVWHPHLSGTTQ
jgi:mannose-6-phosphate isomerase-like protein (cupin superfamily)